MGVRDLAEALILQGMEDLWDDSEQPETAVFFEGEGFSVLSEIAGMSLYDQVKLLHLVETITNHVNRRRSLKKHAFRGRGPSPASTDTGMNIHIRADNTNA